MIHFYKPNPKNTGTACSFWHNSKESTFFGSFIKQASWNAKNRRGSFSQSRGNPNKEVIIKFSDVEIGALIDCIERDVETSGYHQSQKQIVKLNFKKYENKSGERLGFSWGAVKESREDSVNKTNFIIGLSFGESCLLKEHLRFMLNECWAKNSFSYQEKPSEEKGQEEEQEDELE